MSRRVIDISVLPKKGVAADQPGYEMSIENMGHKGIIDQWARRQNAPAPQRFISERPSRASSSGLGGMRPEARVSLLPRGIGSEPMSGPGTIRPAWRRKLEMAAEASPHALRDTSVERKPAERVGR
jgi:hypothetical protein